MLISAIGLDLNHAGAKVIAIDLDGTLTLTDTLHESVMRLVRDRPLSVFALPVWLLKGKAHLKAQITDQVFHESLNRVALRD